MTYDSCNPVQKSVAIVTVTVVRNADKPNFSQAQYNVTVEDTIMVGQVIATVKATDNDKVMILYQCKCFCVEKSLSPFSIYVVC